MQEKDTNKKASPPKRKDTEKIMLGNDYWDRVANDAASGYKNKED